MPRMPRARGGKLTDWPAWILALPGLLCFDPRAAEADSRSAARAATSRGSARLAAGALPWGGSVCRCPVSLLLHSLGHSLGLAGA